MAKNIRQQAISSIVRNHRPGDPAGTGGGGGPFGGGGVLSPHGIRTQDDTSEPSAYTPAQRRANQVMNGLTPTSKQRPRTFS